MDAVRHFINPHQIYFNRLLILEEMWKDELKAADKKTSSFKEKAEKKTPKKKMRWQKQ